MNIAQDIFERMHPASPAVIGPDRMLTYADLQAMSARFSAMLKPLCRRVPNARIGVSAADSPEYIGLALGILLAGGCFVPIPSELASCERDRLIRETGLHALVTEKPGHEFSVELQPAESSRVPFEDRLSSLNPAFVRFSSGTTGRVKGVVLSHETLHERVQAANAGLQITERDRVLWTLPMAHHFAASIILYLWHRASIVLPCSCLPEDVFSSGQREEATVLYSSPFHIDSVASVPGGGWDSLRLAISTTAPLRTEIAVAFASKFGVHPGQALGIIEVGLPCVNSLSPCTRPQSVGKPQGGFEALIKTEEGHCPETGQPGSLSFRGPGMLDAYLTPWQTRSEILSEDGWFATGDIATEDEEGFLTLCGRAGSSINVGGMKFFPEEVEHVLVSHPGVARARVSGRQHAVFGMVPVAHIVASPGTRSLSPRDLTALCRSQLAKYKIPVEFHFVDQLPLTASGKVRRT